MPQTITNQGLQEIRDAIANAIPRVGISTDSTAFAANQTVLSPGGSAVELIKSATIENIDNETVDLKITVDGDTEFTDQDIATIAAMKGGSGDEVVSRSVRNKTIGVEAGDTFTIAVRFKVSDAGS